MTRVRFAPSPTGYLHIGSARTAIFNWLYAESVGGEFILRIEDTDKERSKPEFLQEIKDSLHWLGFNWQEEYYQSRRLSVYLEYAQSLLSKGLAYEQEAKKEGASGKAIIYKVNKDIKVSVDDLVYGKVDFDASLIKDQVLIKSDGMPTYNFACVVDDALLKITHVIRGDDHISNTPKQILLYQALGFDLPAFAHLPLILQKGGGRLSKRAGATSIFEYRQMGMLSEAVCNYLLLLGWSPGNNQEIISMQEAVKRFKLEDVNNTAATFDFDKLTWINNQYICSFDSEKLMDLLLPCLKEKGLVKDGFDRDWIIKIISLFKPRMNNLNDFCDWADFFFKDEVCFDEKARQKFSERDCRKDFQEFKQRFEKLEGFTKEDIESAFRSYIEEKGIKSRDIIHCLRAALTGKTVGPGLFEIMEVLGKERVSKRLCSLDQTAKSSEGL